LLRLIALPAVKAHTAAAFESLLLLLHRLLPCGKVAAVEALPAVKAAAALRLLNLLTLLDLRCYALLLLRREPAAVEALLRSLPVLLARLLALLMRLTVIAAVALLLLLLVAVPAAVAAILRKRGRSRHSRKQYR